MTKIMGGAPTDSGSALNPFDRVAVDVAKNRSSRGQLVTQARTDRAPSLSETVDPAVQKGGVAQAFTLRDLAGSKYKLGSRFDKLVDSSPSLRSGLKQLQQRGFRIEIGDATFTNMKTKTISLAKGDFSRLDYLAQSISHELGHITNESRYVDFRSRNNYISSQLDGEGAAVSFNLKVRQELLDAGRGDIGVLGQPAFAKQAISDWNSAISGRISASQLRQNLAAGYAAQSPQNSPGQTYAQFFGTDFDRLTSYSPELAGKVFRGAASDGI